MPRTITPVERARLTPMILGALRWKQSLGRPNGDPWDAFELSVSEHTPSVIEDLGGGSYTVQPGTGIWRPADVSLVKRPKANFEGFNVLSFQITGVHYNNFPDGFYRISPALVGSWNPSGILASLRFFLFQPIAARFVLTQENPVQTCDFELTSHGVISGRQTP